MKASSKPSLHDVESFTSVSLACISDRTEVHMHGNTCIHMNTKLCLLSCMNEGAKEERGCCSQKRANDKEQEQHKSDSQQVAWHSCGGVGGRNVCSGNTGPPIGVASNGLAL